MFVVHFVAHVSDKSCTYRGEGFWEWSPVPSLQEEMRKCIMSVCMAGVERFFDPYQVTSFHCKGEIYSVVGEEQVTLLRELQQVKPDSPLRMTWFQKEISVYNTNEGN